MKARQKRSRYSLDPNTVVLIKQIVIGVIVIGFVGLVLSAIWYGTRLTAMTIDEVSVSGGETVDHGDIEVKVWEQLSGEYLKFIPRKFSVLYPRQAIVESLSAVDRVHTVSVERNGWKGLRVSFEEYAPKALWCGSVDDRNCLFLDKSGYAFAPAPVLDGGQFLRFVEIGQSPELHTFITDVSDVEKVVYLVQLLTEIDWYVSHVEVGQDSNIFLRLVGGGELKIDLDEPPKKTLENLLVILGSDKFNHLKPGNFQYIDLRFGNKVYVNEEISVPEVEVVTEHASSSETE
jgi:cell division septal protein FtsQ